MFQVGNYEIDETKIAPAVVTRLLQRATAHILNNECAANVLGKTKRAIVGKDGKPDSVTDAMLAEWRGQDANAAAIAEWEDAFCNSKIAALYDGTLSVRVARGPTRDPIEAAARAIAKGELVMDLKNRGGKFPKGDDLFTITDAAGTDHSFTGDEMIDRRLAHPEHGPRIMRDADKKVKDEKRLRDNMAKAVGADVGGLAASLGL